MSWTTFNKRMAYNYTIGGKVFSVLLLSPEQILDCEGCAWMREATREEGDAFKAEHPKLFDNLSADFRPYFLTTIDTDHAQFPPHLREQVMNGLRIFRFRDY